MFAETQDQQLFERTTARFLDTHYPTGRVRALAGSESTFEPSLWRDAAQLGWTALLAGEDAGGGSVSGNGLADLLIVAFQFGRHAAPGPLLGTNVVAAALCRWGSPDQRDGALAELVAGDAAGAWAHAAAGGPLGTSGPRVTAAVSGEKAVLSGRAGHVESAADARYLLVTADEPAGRTQYLVHLAAPGVQLAPLRTLDLTRRFHDVVLHDVVLPAGARVGEPGTAGQHDAHLLDVMAVLVLGELVGSIDRAFGMTAEWVAHRYSFGRPLSSYQEIKHRMADMRTHLEASQAVASRAAAAVGTGAPDGPSWASAGMTYVGQHGPEVIQDCIQLHGGIGVTYDHDLHLLLRRAVLDSQLLGAPGDFAQRLGAMVATTAGTIS
jgi:alkylation response protein AidB-like acyl-CoA dehydrogenase